MMIATSPRLRLQAWTLEDEDAAFRVWGDPTAMKFAGGATPRNQCLGVLRAAAEAQATHGYQLWAIVLLEADVIVGAGGFHPGERSGELELAFHIDPAFWGQGIATEASEVALSYNREALGGLDVIASAHVDHGASRRVLEKLGFTFEGIEFFEDLGQNEAMYRLSQPKG